MIYPKFIQNFQPSDQTNSSPSHVDCRILQLYLNSILLSPYLFVDMFWSALARHVFLQKFKKTNNFVQSTVAIFVGPQETLLATVKLHKLV